MDRGQNAWGWKSWARPSDTLLGNADNLGTMSKAEQGRSGETLEQHTEVPKEVNRKSSPYFRYTFVCKAGVLSEVCSEGHRLVVWPPLLLGGLLPWIFSLASDPQQTENSPGDGCFLVLIFNYLFIKLFWVLAAEYEIFVASCRIFLLWYTAL